MERNLYIGTHGFNPYGLVLVLALLGKAEQCLLWESITFSAGLWLLHAHYEPEEDGQVYEINYELTGISAVIVSAES